MSRLLRSRLVPLALVAATLTGSLPSPGPALAAGATARSAGGPAQEPPRPGGEGPGDAAIRGTVVDLGGQPIPDALVRLFGTNRVLIGDAVTGADGRFRFSPVPPGRYELRVTAPPFRDRDQIVELSDADVELVITLSPAAVEERVTVTASRGLLQETDRVPASVRTLGIQELRARAVDLLPRMLAEEASVIAQQTTPGQGSPILRGQSAQAVLYLVDGIRYNNATYRQGNTQYLGWIPAAGVDAVEVMLGPAAVNYGSDALGGAINVITSALPGHPPAGWRVNGNLRAFGESASLGAGADLALGLSGRRFAAYLTGAGSRHQDLRAGGGQDSHNALIRFLGLTPSQVKAILGPRLRGTAYGSWGLTAKASWRWGTVSSLSGLLIRSEQHGVRRYDRLLGGDGRFRAEFEPQRLEFGYLRYQSVLDDLLIQSTFSVNRQVDGRRDQRRPTGRLEVERNAVTALGYQASASWGAGRHLLTAGGEVYDEFIDSSQTAFTPDGHSFPVRARFPDGARYTSLGVFLLDEWEAVRDRVQVSAGTRLSAFRYDVDAEDNVIGGIPVVPSATATFTDLTFNAGATVAGGGGLSLFGRVARGFRAPSVFDLGEQGLTGGGFEVAPDEAVRLGALVGDSAGIDAASTGRPWRELEPEVAWSLEAGLRWQGRSSRLELVAFDTELLDALERRALIVPRPAVGEPVGGQTIVAQDPAGRIFVAADPRPVVSRANIGHTRIWGIEAHLRWGWSPSWTATVKAGLQRGRELDTGKFARKIAPDHLVAALRWSRPRGGLWLEGLARAFADQDRLSPFELADPRVGAFRTASTIASFFNNAATWLGLVQDGVLTVTGETLQQVQLRVLGPGLRPGSLFRKTPGFVTLSVRGGVALDGTHELHFGVDNLLDKNYRIHGSGFDAPGINVTLAYEARF